MGKQLICCDWDQTLFPGHMHNFLAEYLKSLREVAPEEASEFNQDPASQIKFLKEKYFSCFADDEKIRWDQHRKKVRELITEVIEKGHRFSIVTFSSFPGAIKLFLVDAEIGLGLPSELASNIAIYHDFNAQKAKNKKEDLLIKAEADCYQHDLTFRRVIFIDDSWDNIAASKQSCPDRMTYLAPVLDAFCSKSNEAIDLLQGMVDALPAIVPEKLCELALARLFNRHLSVGSRSVQDQQETLLFLRDLENDHEVLYEKLVTMLDQHTMRFIGVEFFQRQSPALNEIELFKLECKEAYCSVSKSLSGRMRRSG